jgi:WD40 repeat protein
MAEHSNQANEKDAVLGGQNTVNAGDSDMVLGRLEVVKRRLAADSGSNLVAEWKNSYPFSGYSQNYSAPSNVKSALFSPDGNAIVFNNGNCVGDGEGDGYGDRYDHDFVLWDWRKNVYLHTFSGWSSGGAYAEELCSFTTSPDGQFLACGGNYGTIQLWNLTTGKFLRTLEERSHSIDWYAYTYKGVDAVAFSPDGQILAGWKGIGRVGRSGTIQLWNLCTGELLHTLEGHSDRVVSVAFSPDGQILASGSLDKTIKLWSLTTGKLLCTLEGHLGNCKRSSDSYNFFNVNSVAISPDGRVLASGGGDKSIKLWNLSTGDLVQTLEEDSAYIDSVTLAFSPEGQILASGGSDSVIKLWNLSTGELLGSLDGGLGSIRGIDFRCVNSVAFSPDGRFLVNVIGITVKVWRIR